MAKLIFQGSSDDTFGEVNFFKKTYSDAFGALIAYLVHVDNGGMIVTGQYNGPKWPELMPAVWNIGISPIGENKDIPDWKIRFKLAENGYSMSLEIDAPDEVKILCLNKVIDSIELF